MTTADPKSTAFQIHFTHSLPKAVLVIIPCLLIVGCADQPPANNPPAIESAPINLPMNDFWQRILNPPASEWAGAASAPPQTHPVRLEIVVEPNGKVRSVKPLSGQKDYYDRAVHQFDGLVFFPFTKDGKPIAARFVVPTIVETPRPQSSAPRSFPEIRDISKVRISLQRSPCYGRCPAYKVEIAGNGAVEFSGAPYGSPVAENRSSVAPEKVAQLIKSFQNARFFELQDVYASRITDNPTYTVLFSVEDQAKKVIDYVGQGAGMPEAVADLEDQIDLVADTPRWLSGTSYDAVFLAEQKFDFKSPKASEILADLAGHGYVEQCHEFEKRGAHFSDDAKAYTALSAAAGRGKVEAVALMLDRGVAKNDQGAKIEALYAAAGSGRLAVAKLLVASGVDPAGISKRHGASVIAAAAQSGNLDLVRLVLQRHPDVHSQPHSEAIIPSAVRKIPWRDTSSEDIAEIVRALVAAGADVNGRGLWQDTALHVTSDPVVVRALLDCGADPNIRNQRGESPLDKVRNEGAALSLIQAGADVNARNDIGISFMDRARAYGWQKVMDMARTK